MQTNAINVSKLKTKLEHLFHNKYDEATESLAKPAHRPCVVRQYPNPDTTIIKSLADGNCNVLKMPVIKTEDTAILFNPDYDKFHYDGLDRHINDWEGQQNPRGEHFVEEMANDEHRHTKKYHSIGHCPHGSIGDALLYGDVVLLITDVYLKNTSNDGLIAEWIMNVEPLDIKVTKH